MGEWPYRSSGHAFSSIFRKSLYFDTELFKLIQSLKFKKKTENKKDR